MKDKVSSVYYQTSATHFSASWSFKYSVRRKRENFITAYTIYDQIENIHTYYLWIKYRYFSFFFDV